MVYIIWRCLWFILKPILALEQSFNLPNWTVVSSLICCRSNHNNFFFCSRKEECMHKKKTGKFLMWAFCNTRSDFHAPVILIHHVSLNMLSFNHYCFSKLNKVHSNYVWISKWVHFNCNWINLSILNSLKQWVADYRCLFGAMSNI